MTAVRGANVKVLNQPICCMKGARLNVLVTRNGKGLLEESLIISWLFVAGNHFSKHPFKVALVDSNYLQRAGHPHDIHCVRPHGLEADLLNGGPALAGLQR